MLFNGKNAQRTLAKAKSIVGILRAKKIIECFGGS